MLSDLLGYEFELKLTIFDFSLIIKNNFIFLKEYVGQHQLILDLFKLYYDTGRMIFHSTSVYDMDELSNLFRRVMTGCGFRLIFNLWEKNHLFFEASLSSFDFITCRYEWAYHFNAEGYNDSQWDYFIIPLIIFIIFTFYLILRVKRLITALLNYCQEELRCEEYGSSHSDLWYMPYYRINKLNRSMKYNTEIKSAQEANEIIEKAWFDCSKIIDAFVTNKFIQFILLYNTFFFLFFSLFQMASSFFFFFFFLIFLIIIKKLKK